jgi:hypothetical protein
MHNETEPLDVSKSEISIVCRGVPKLLRGTYVIEMSSHKANHFASLILRLPITEKVTGNLRFFLGVSLFTLFNEVFANKPNISTCVHLSVLR